MLRPASILPAGPRDSWFPGSPASAWCSARTGSCVRLGTGAGGVARTRRICKAVQQHGPFCRRGAMRACVGRWNSYALFFSAVGLAAVVVGGGGLGWLFRLKKRETAALGRGGGAALAEVVSRRISARFAGGRTRRFRLNQAQPSSWSCSRSRSSSRRGKSCPPSGRHWVAV